MDSGLVEIILAVIGLLGLVLTAVIAPYYFKKTSVQTRAEHRAIVSTAVYAVEQMQKSGLLVLPKKEAVLEYINNKGIKITAEDLDMFIEEAVLKLNLDKLKSGY